jgi:hypothetical protein
MTDDAHALKIHHYRAIISTTDTVMPTKHYNPSSSHHRLNVNDDNPINTTIGKRSGIIIPPRGTIGRNSADYENFYESCDAVKSPGLSEKKKAPKNANGAVKSRVEFKGNLKSPPEILALLEQDEDIQGAATPKITASIKNLLSRAMGIKTNDSPANTVLSKVSTAPPSDTRIRKDPRFSFDEVIDSKDDEKADPLVRETAKGNWEEQGAADFLLSDAINTDSVSKTPKMENTMEELVKLCGDEYDDEYDNDNQVDAEGFDLATHQDVAFKSDHNDSRESHKEVKVRLLPCNAVLVIVNNHWLQHFHMSTKLFQ